jgi:hypothetical protein
MDVDRLGRVRKPEQNRGLRPLHPALPSRWESRSFRVAMSSDDWRRLEDLARAWSSVEPDSTLARAYGRAISHLLNQVALESPGPQNWMDWERQKTLKLLRHAV